VVGVLLGGIVSLQVAALRANMAAGDVRRETRRVQAEVGNLEAAIAKETTPETIAAAARRMGMIYAPADAVRTVRVRRAGAVR
jgi:cell division protein FtsL